MRKISVITAGVSSIIGTLLLVATVCAASPAEPTTSPTPSMAAMNPAFQQFMNNPSLAVMENQLVTGMPLGYVPPPVDLSHTKGQQIRSLNQLNGLTAMPASYDLRKTGKLTNPKNQGACGTCWAVAGYASLESCLLPGQRWDFSENHAKNNHGYKPVCCDGGDSYILTAYLARWSGPVAESSDPYNVNSCVSKPNAAVVKHIQDVDFIPDRQNSLDNNNIKQALMNYGAVYTSLYWDDTCYYNTWRSYYFKRGGTSNHAVTIVGWDDNFDKNKFSPAAPGNGAFIVRNDWGSGWADGGYFYISYYDTNVGTQLALFRDAEPTNNFKDIYQYDWLGWVQCLGYKSETAWFANAFTAKSDGLLSAVSFYTGSVDSSYEVYIYMNPPLGGPLSASGPVSTASGTIPCPGYHTVDLDTLVPIATGQDFSVVVKLTTPDNYTPIPIESPYPGYSPAATAARDQSYMSPDGKNWTDVTLKYPNTNVCLKAFTVNSSMLKVPAPKFSIQGGELQGPQSVTITCGMTGAVIHYTTNGNAPTAVDPTVASGGSVLVDHNMTLKAAAWMPNYYTSDVTSASYVIVVSTLPVNVSLSPNSGTLATGVPMTISSTFSDPEGSGHVSRCYLLINDKLSTMYSICMKYDAEKNLLYILDERDTMLMGGFAPGSGNTIENKYFALYCGDTTIVRNGNNLTVNWRLMLKPYVSGAVCSGWMCVVDKSGKLASWTKLGNFTIK